MSMLRCMCNKCNRIVQDVDIHFCSFYKNDGIVHKLREQDETEKVDRNRDETIGKFAENLEDSNGNVCESTKQMRTALKLSTSRVHSASYTENKELNERSFKKSIDSAHCSFARDGIFPDPERKWKLDEGADQPLDLTKAASSVPGPSISHTKIIEPDGERLYACDKCPYRCKNKTHFDIHYRKHTGFRPHVCSTCWKSFTQKGNLKAHERIHTAEKPYVCEKCDKSFSQRGALNMHLRTHTGERPFECPICKRRFADSSNFRRHVASWCRGPYRCGRCVQTFSSNEDRNRHIMQQHP